MPDFKSVPYTPTSASIIDLTIDESDVKSNVLPARLPDLTLSYGGHDYILSPGDVMYLRPCLPTPGIKCIRLYYSLSGRSQIQRLRRIPHYVTFTAPPPVYTPTEIYSPTY